ncbi:hypothetical protein SNE40_002951 [Patella caerulea]|uniref:Uncharacterized protein n=1 Tax=Patella caerulea TaxID=87958 RepID=A0AAN8K206_PATCE
MVKSRAEIQREYRQRLKEKNNEAYLKKERERRKKNYAPSSLLPRKERLKRNMKNKKYLRRYRRRLREQAAIDAAVENDESILNSSGYESTNTSHEQVTPLMVRMSFPNRRNGSRRRVSRAVATAK